MNYRAPPAFSLTSSLKKTITQMPQREHSSPGPIYDHQASTATKLKRSYSIGKAERLAINHGIEHTPSPHHYSPKRKSLKHPITFAKAQPINPEAEVPPIGAHDPLEKVTKPKVLTYSMGQKYPSIMTNSNPNPGPGSYQTTTQILPILSKSKNAKQTKFGTSKRFSYEVNPSPGVGNYSLETTSSLLNKKTSLPMAQKLKNPKEMLPGPGEYLVKSQFSEKGEKGKSLSMRFKSPFQVKNDTAFAFGKYFQNEQSMAALQNSKMFSFGRQKRQSPTKLDLPGPTEYITDTFAPKNSFATILPRSERTEYNGTLEFPGPGSYQIINDTGRSPAFGKSKSTAWINANPGPGRYQPRLLEKESRGGRFGSQKKGVLKVEEGGSVGNYEVGRELQAKRGSFTKSARFLYKNERQPGPGDYQIHDIINYHIKSKQTLSKLT